MSEVFKEQKYLNRDEVEKILEDEGYYDVTQTILGSNLRPDIYKMVNAICNLAIPTKDKIIKVLKSKLNYSDENNKRFGVIVKDDIEIIANEILND